MAVTFASLKTSYINYNKLDTAMLYESLGWQDLADKPGWDNTCAIRMHLALLDAGVNMPGRYEIQAGKHKGKPIEVSQNRLAQKIENSGRFGAVSKLTHKQFAADLGQLWYKTGIVSFQQMIRYSGAHIDLLDSRGSWSCLRTCYLGAGEIWFWNVA